MLWSRFALRYMFSPKSHSVINTIAWVSLVAVAVPTAAMIILLAMFNGLTDSIDKLNSALSADIEIVAQRGQTFSLDDLDLDKIAEMEGVESFAPYIEQSIMATSAGRNYPIMVRGVGAEYFNIVPINEYISRGTATSILAGDILLGASLASSLGAYGIGTEIELYALNRKQISTLLPTSGISKLKSHLGGIISANNEINESVALMEIERTQRLLNHESRVSALAIKLSPNTTPKTADRALTTLIGDDFDTVTRDEKNASINAILRMEKFAIMLIGALIALIATFSIVGSVVMLMTEKRKDIATLSAIGAKPKLIREIFIGEGVMLSSAGAIVGLILGITFTLIQRTWGVVKIPGNGLLESYPVSLNAIDVVMVIAIIISLGAIISTLTVKATLKRHNQA